MSKPIVNLDPSGKFDKFPTGPTGIQPKNLKFNAKLAKLQKKLDKMSYNDRMEHYLKVYKKLQALKIDVSDLPKPASFLRFKSMGGKGLIPIPEVGGFEGPVMIDPATGVAVQTPIQQSIELTNSIIIAEQRVSAAGGGSTTTKRTRSDATIAKGRSKIYTQIAAKLAASEKDSLIPLARLKWTDAPAAQITKLFTSNQALAARVIQLIERTLGITIPVASTIPLGDNTTQTTAIASYVNGLITQIGNLTPEQQKQLSTSLRDIFIENTPNLDPALRARWFPTRPEVPQELKDEFVNEMSNVLNISQSDARRFYSGLLEIYDNEAFKTAQRDGDLQSAFNLSREKFIDDIVDKLEEFKNQKRLEPTGDFKESPDTDALVDSIERIVIDTVNSATSSRFTGVVGGMVRRLSDSVLGKYRTRARGQAKPTTQTPQFGSDSQNPTTAQPPQFGSDSQNPTTAQPTTQPPQFGSDSQNQTTGDFATKPNISTSSQNRATRSAQAGAINRTLISLPPSSIMVIDLGSNASDASDTSDTSSVASSDDFSNTFDIGAYDELPQGVRTPQRRDSLSNLPIGHIPIADLLKRFSVYGRIVKIRRIRSGDPPDDDPDPLYTITIDERPFAEIRHKKLVALLAALLLAGGVLGKTQLDGGIIGDPVVKPSDSKTIPGTTPGTTPGIIDTPGETSVSDDKHSFIPTGASVRNHEKIGGEAFILGATDNEIDHQEKLWEEFITRLPRGGEMADIAIKLMNMRFGGLVEPNTSHSQIVDPVGRPEDVPRMRNIYQFDDHFNDFQEDVYDNFTPVMQSDRKLSSYENEKSIYYDSAYNKQIRKPRRPVIFGNIQKRNDGLDFAEFSYATGGLLNRGNHSFINGGHEEPAFPNMYGFAQRKSLPASVYKASRARRR